MIRFHSTLVFQTCMKTFQANLTYLNAGKHGKASWQSIQCWCSSESKVEKSHDDKDNHQNTISKLGRSRTPKPEDEHFGYVSPSTRVSRATFSLLFGISQPTISRNFIFWINFMYLRFGTSVSIFGQPATKLINHARRFQSKIPYAHEA